MMAEVPTPPRRLLDRLASGFALDLRSLALFRALLGLMLLSDGLQRLFNLGAFQTDAGLLPRALLSDSSWRWSIHLASGESWLQGLLLLGSLISASMLALGWRTRVAATLSWLLLVSASNRNPLLIDNGDSLLMALLFWGLFLPLGARWSVDRALGGGHDRSGAEPYLSWAAIALVMQILSSLFFNALFQAQNPAWIDGAAFGQWLNSAQWSWGIGPILAGQAGLARLLGQWWWWLQLLGPLIWLLPLARTGRLSSTQTRLRQALLLQWLLLQLLIVACLVTGSLPWVQLLAISALIPAAAWDPIGAWVRRRRAAGQLRVFYDRDCSFCLRTVQLLKELLLLDDAQLLPAQNDRRADALMRANQSWVVLDRDDQAYLQGKALLLLMARSPVFAVAGRLALQFKLGTQMDRIYALIARHRDGISALSRELPRPTPSSSAGPLAQRLAALLMLLVLIANVAGLSSAGSRLLAALAAPLEVLRLDQRWDQLARSPDGDRWWVAPGLLADGREIDVLRPRQTLSFDRPRHLARETDGTRWRNWQESLAADGQTVERSAWAQYLCRRWNQGRAPNDAQGLQEFRLVEMFAATAHADTPHRFEQRVRLRQDCGIGNR